MNTHYRHKCCGLQSPISLIGNLWSAQPGLERLKPQRQEGESEGTGVREKEIDEEKESNKNIQESCSIIGTVCQSPILCAWVGQGSHLVPTETQHLQEQFLVPPTSQQRRADSSTLRSSLQDYCVCVCHHTCVWPYLELYFKEDAALILQVSVRCVSGGVWRRSSCSHRLTSQVRVRFIINIPSVHMSLL